MEIGSFVLVRTFSAGVHFGTLAKRDGKEVTLTDARRIWSWKGANTLHEIAIGGVSKGSRISEAVSVVLPIIKDSKGRVGVSSVEDDEL